MSASAKLALIQDFSLCRMPKKIEKLLTVVSLLPAVTVANYDRRCDRFYRGMALK